jgi:biopolymer transport protein ExbD
VPLKTESVEEPVLNLTPMIDIVFLLVIFFMVGAQFTEMEQSVDVKLPTVAEVQPLTAAPDALVVNVQENGAIDLNGRPQTLEQLVASLEAARENFAEQAVLVRGDREGRYQFVMDVLAACNRADIQRISLANEPRKEPPR